MRRKITKRELLGWDKEQGLWILGDLLRSEVTGETGSRVKNGDGTLMKLFFMFLGLAMEEDLSIYSYGGLLDALPAVICRRRRLERETMKREKEREMREILRFG